MTQVWEWETCRLSSERVFTMMDSGRLPKAWNDLYAIKDVHRDAIAIGNREYAQRQANTTRTNNAATNANTHKQRTANQTTQTGITTESQTDSHVTRGNPGSHG